MKRFSVDKIVLIVVGFAVVLLVANGIVTATRAHAVEEARAAHEAQQHAALHAQNVRRRHEAALAYNRAHPEEVARRRAAAIAQAAEAERDRKAAAAAKAAEDAAEAQRVAQANAQAALEAHPCDTASDKEKYAMSALNADSYQRAYDLAVSGIHYADECDSDGMKAVSKGYLMSVKAYAEHHLGSGDWKTDFNEANQLLEECVTTPGIYGTHIAAQCETQQSYNIKASVNWEMND